MLMLLSPAFAIIGVPAATIAASAMFLNAPVGIFMCFSCEWMVQPGSADA